MSCDSLPLATDPGNACGIETALAEPVTIIKVMTNMMVARITMIMITTVTMNAG
jgi:hypothetical protein